uniref:Sulfotransferase family protein n=1 Tax=Megaviridae environmental sample TaxID=1737588 RepID=A0A5J6VK88_9VIRU|nr:MAG: hypothetical protein [Megaviridae environmental sample]
MEKILITGTGRCGTTFLIKLFSFLGFNTGYNRDNYNLSISPNCNSGMERDYRENYYILKNPTFMSDIEKIIKNESITIKNVIIPIRELSISAKSRVKHWTQNGGLWCAHDELSQINFYKDILTNYIYISTKYDINTIFIDFDKMISDKTYLFNKLKNILDEKNIGLDDFSLVYDEVSLSSKP